MIGVIFQHFWDFEAPLFVCARLSEFLHLPYLCWHWPCPWLREPFAMQVHEIKWVFVIPKLAPSQWLAACLPAIPHRGENSMTRTTVVCLTQRECTEATARMLL